MLLFHRLFHASAAPAFVLRCGIVGCNLAAMLGLVAWLGIDAFGLLIVAWGFSLVASTLVGGGAPLYFLEILGQGRQITWIAFATQLLGFPAILCAIGIAILSTLWPNFSWAAILVAGFCIHLSACVASIMRALGSVQFSMVLRDTGPLFALCLAAFISDSGVAEVLWFTGLLLGGLSLILLFRSGALTAGTSIIARDGRPTALPKSLWWSSVLGMVLAQLDIIIGGLFMTGGQIGTYALLRRLVNLVALPVSVATWVTAVPITRAFGAKDHTALGAAISNSARIALVPGFALFCAGCLIVAFAHFSGTLWGVEGTWIALVLLCAMLTQVIFATGTTVATLCGLAHLAAGSRMVSVLSYLGLILLMPVFDPLINASLYFAATLAGSITLWAIVQERLGFDTSAAVLWDRPYGGDRWKLS